MWLMPGCPLPSPTPWITPRTLRGSSLAPVTHLIPPTPYLQADYGQGHPELCLFQGLPVQIVGLQQNLIARG